MTACSITDALPWLSGPQEVTQANSQTDALAMAAQGGDQAAFQSLMELYQTRLHRFCWRWLNCAEEARDATQETFVKAWFALEHYEARGHFEAWLFRIAINLCRDKAKSRAGRQQQRTISMELTSAEAVRCKAIDPSEQSAQQGDMQKLQQGLALLSEKLRLPMLLCGVEGMSQKEAAAIIGCSVRAVEGRMRRAREELERWWGER